MTTKYTCVYLVLGIHILSLSFEIYMKNVATICLFCFLAFHFILLFFVVAFHKIHNISSKWLFYELMIVFRVLCMSCVCLCIKNQKKKKNIGERKRKTFFLRFWIASNSHELEKRQEKNKKIYKLQCVSVTYFNDKY